MFMIRCCSVDTGYGSTDKTEAIALMQDYAVLYGCRIDDLELRWIEEFLQE